MSWLALTPAQDESIWTSVGVPAVPRPIQPPAAAWESGGGCTKCSGPCTHGKVQGKCLALGFGLNQFQLLWINLKTKAKKEEKENCKKAGRLLSVVPVAKASSDSDSLMLLV